jgi:HEAT repeat protein
MRIRRLRFTTRSLMVVVFICALLVWIAPRCLDFAWTWTVIRDVHRGQSMRYSAIGYARAGPRAMRALREALKSDQIKTRMAAAQSLGEIGQDAKAAVPDLLETARHDQDPLVRVYATASIGQIGPGAKEAVEPLIRLLQSEKDLQMAATIIQTFHELGPTASAALPVLATMAKDPTCNSRFMAAWAMCRIAPDARAEASIVVPQLIVQLTTAKNSNSRRFAADVLAEIGPAAKPAISALSAAEEDPDKDVRRAAAKALEAINREPADTEQGNPTPEGKP